MWPPGSAGTVCPRPSVTLTFDRLTLKLVCESHLKWGTFIPNLVTPGGFDSRIIRYVRDGRTDRRTDKSNAYCHIPTVGGITRKHQCADGRGCGCRQPDVRTVRPVTARDKTTTYTCRMSSTRPRRYSISERSISATRNRSTLDTLTTNE